MKYLAGLSLGYSPITYSCRPKMVPDIYTHTGTEEAVRPPAGPGHTVCLRNSFIHQRRAGAADRDCYVMNSVSLDRHAAFIKHKSFVFFFPLDFILSCICTCDPFEIILIHKIIGYGEHGYEVCLQFASKCVLVAYHHRKWGLLKVYFEDQMKVD